MGKPRQKLKFRCASPVPGQSLPRWDLDGPFLSLSLASGSAPSPNLRAAAQPAVAPMPTGPHPRDAGGGRAGIWGHGGAQCQEEPSVRFPQSPIRRWLPAFLPACPVPPGVGGLSPWLGSALTPTPAQRVCWQQRR